MSELRRWWIFGWHDNDGVTHDGVYDDENAGKEDHAFLTNHPADYPWVSELIPVVEVPPVDLNAPRTFSDCLERITAVMEPLNHDGTSSAWSKLWNIHRAVSVLRDAMGDKAVADCPAAIELAFQAAQALTAYAEGLAKKGEGK